jgi:hypothetical protein
MFILIGGVKYHAKKWIFRFFVCEKNFIPSPKKNEMVVL